jgi:FkbM family methyltransferase
MSLEVGEHLPAHFEDIFIQNLHNNNKYGIVLSWAVKGQGGHGHFNEQNNDYIKSKIGALGYIIDIENENKLRQDSTLHWFKNTIMVFRKKYYYKQDNYNLCLLYNKPEHLNSNIVQLPNTYNIGSYIDDYRKYFNSSEKSKFMIDIGANMGLSACPVLSMGHKVVCFEPELLNIEILKSVKIQNNFDNMFIENYAVIGERGKNKTIFYSNINREDNSSVNEICCGKNVNNIGIIKKEVNSITLDEWHELNKNEFNLYDLLLIKIDVQGGELEILKGAEHVLKQCSIYGTCHVEIECDEGFMNILNINFDTINSLMDSYGYLCSHKGYDSVFIPKKPIDL